MEYANGPNIRPLSRPFRLLVPVMALLLLFAAACGTAATTEESAEPPAAAPQAQQQQQQAQPTAIPQAMTEAAQEAMASPEVNPGNVVMLVSDFGTERFDTIYGSTFKELRKHFHSNLTSWDSFDGVMKITPGVATKWELANDGKTIIYTVREGALFHDGTEITPEDVLWTLRHSVGPGAEEWGYSGVTVAYATKMDRIELGPGPNQVSVHSTVGIPEAPVYWSENEGGASMGQVMPARSSLHDQAELDAYEKNPIGAGPVKLVKHVPLEAFFFERHDGYYYQPDHGFQTDRRLSFQTLEMRQVPDESTRVAAIRAGEADIGRLSMATRKQVEADGGKLVFSPEAVIVESHFWGCYKEGLGCSNKGVRQAFNYALDKELLRDRLFGPEVMDLKGWWVVTPSTIGYSDELAPWPYDPDKARQLFAEAGYKTPDNPGGEDIGTFVINTYADQLVPNLIESARLAADMWEKELGIETEVRVMDKVNWGLLRNEEIEKLDGQINWVAQNTRLDAAGIARLYFLSIHKNLTDVGATRVHKNDEIFAMMEETLAATGQPGYEQVYNDTWLKLQEESYQISVGYLNPPIGVGPRILNWEPYGVSEYISALHTIELDDN